MYIKILLVLFLCLELGITSNHTETPIKLSEAKVTVAEGITLNNASSNLETNKSIIEQRNVKPRKGVISKTIVPRKGVQVALNISTTNSSDTVHVISEKYNNTKPFKPKPTVTTVDDFEDDDKIIKKPVKSSSSSSSSNKLNYILPVVAAIFLLPIVIVFIMFIYNNYCDCWEKRHYRRMDFLVDGMYNE